MVDIINGPGHEVAGIPFSEKMLGKGEKPVEEVFPDIPLYFPRHSDQEDTPEKTEGKDREAQAGDFQSGDQKEVKTPFVPQSVIDLPDNTGDEQLREINQQKRQQ
jgi:hypothetical protein